VRPEPSSAGQIILHRHLVDQPGISIEVYGSEPKRPTLSRLLRRILGRLGKTRLRRFVEDVWVLWDGRWIDPELPASIEHPERSIVLTVAHGDAFMAAQRFAKRHKLPLVSIFHDWWPDMAEVHPFAKAILERKFLQLARESAVTFCVCEGMKEALGPVANAIILPPCPAEMHAIPSPPRDPKQPYKIVYSGNLGDYGPMLGDALEESLKYPEILLQVRGSNPGWSEERKAKMRANGRWLDFAPRAELDAWLASTDAFLVPMVFDPRMRRRMETSFPSKLIEFAQFGKPIVVWGPEYCSAVKWAKACQNTVSVENPSAAFLAGNLMRFFPNTRDEKRQGVMAKHATYGEFEPESIRKVFQHSLRRVL
jgi:hypothetical protein